MGRTGVGGLTGDRMEQIPGVGIGSDAAGYAVGWRQREEDAAVIAPNREPVESIVADILARGLTHAIDVELRLAHVEYGSEDVPFAVAARGATHRLAGHCVVA
eukprot:scaffold55663_cov35-Tisochrysis_lutea.AAC.1